MGDDTLAWSELLTNETDYDLSDWQWNLIKDYTAEGRRCMMDFWKQPKQEGLFCNATWDHFNCWPSVPAKTIYLLPCPEKLVGEVQPNESLVAHRTCTESGEWDPDWSNYTACVLHLIPYLYEKGDLDIITYDQGTDDNFDDRFRKAKILRDIYFFGSIVCLLLLLVTLFIFTYFKDLQCNRLSIHKQLVITFMLKAIVIIVMFEPFVTRRKSRSYRDVSWICSGMNVLQNYFIMANIFWTFVEGLYLHNKIAVSAFNKIAISPSRIFFAIGWGLPAIIVAAWAVCMYINSEELCWNMWSRSPYAAILTAPLIIALAINAIFLCNIIRILVTKLRANNTPETLRIRKAVKAAVILFPLLGLTNLLFFFTIKEGNDAETAYRIFNAVSQSTQGIFVSVIYCFWNSEVRAVIKKRWQRHKAKRLDNNFFRRRSSRTSSFAFSNTAVGRRMKSSVRHKRLPNCPAQNPHRPTPTLRKSRDNDLQNSALKSENEMAMKISSTPLTYWTSSI